MLSQYSQNTIIFLLSAALVDYNRPIKPRKETIIMSEIIATTIRIPENIKEELTRLAKEDGRSFNNLVSLILTKYIQENSKK